MGASGNFSACVPASGVGPTGPASTVPGPTGPTGPGVGATGPTGPASSVTGPTGPTGPASASITPQTLAFASTIAWNMSLGVNAALTMTGNAVLGAPSNIQSGSSGALKIIQDGTGTRLMTYNSVWKFQGGTVPSLSTAPGAADTLAYYSPDGTNLFAALTKNYQ